MSEAAGSSDQPTIDALRRIKAVEEEWEAKLSSARAEQERALVDARSSADAAVKAVSAELEASRTQALETAGAAADAEARDLLAAGEADAARAKAGKKKLADRKDEVLQAVLGEFAPP